MIAKKSVYFTGRKALQNHKLTDCVPKRGLIGY